MECWRRGLVSLLVGAVLLALPACIESTPAPPATDPPLETGMLWQQARASLLKVNGTVSSLQIVPTLSRELAAGAPSSTPIADGESLLVALQEGFVGGAGELECTTGQATVLREVTADALWRHTQLEVNAQACLVQHPEIEEIDLQLPIHGFGLELTAIEAMGSVAPLQGVPLNLWVESDFRLPAAVTALVEFRQVGDREARFAAPGAGFKTTVTAATREPLLPFPITAAVPLTAPDGLYLVAMVFNVGISGANDFFGEDPLFSTFAVQPFWTYGYLWLGEPGSWYDSSAPELRLQGTLARETRHLRSTIHGTFDARLREPLAPAGGNAQVRSVEGDVRVLAEVRRDVHYGFYERDGLWRNFQLLELANFAMRTTGPGWTQVHGQVTLSDVALIGSSFDLFWGQDFTLNKRVVDEAVQADLALRYSQATSGDLTMLRFAGSITLSEPRSGEGVTAQTIQTLGALPVSDAAGAPIWLCQKGGAVAVDAAVVDCQADGRLRIRSGPNTIQFEAVDVPGDDPGLLLPRPSWNRVVDADSPP